MAAHDTSCIAFVNTPRIVTPCIVGGMATIRAERLRQARQKAGFESATDAASRFGWTESAYRHHENGTRNYGLDAARKYGRAFKVKPGWLLGLEHVNGLPPDEPATEDSLVVNGGVQAGTWSECLSWDDDRAFIIINMPSPISPAGRLGLVVEGRSMDEVYEPGTVLDCVSIYSVAVKPQTGDHVIVEQRRPDGLRERTVKEYRQEDGRFFLVPRSSQPRWEPIEYLGPDANHPDESGVEVIAFVVAAYPPRTLDLFKRMGMVKPTK